MARYLSKTIPSISSTENGIRSGMGLGIKEVKELSGTMTDKLGIPFNLMPLSYLKRRISYLLPKYNLQTVSQFIEFLSTDEAKDKIAFDFPVEATELFRDPGFWRYLRSLLLTLRSDDSINVWFPETVTGEELFSFLIIVDELDMLDKFSILCQHPSQQRLDDICNGIPNNKNLNTNSNNYTRIEGKKQLEDYYTLENNKFILKSYLLKNVTIKQGHFFNTPAPENTGIIIFRNNMLYFNRDGADRCIDTLLPALLPGGIIAIGAKEQIPEAQRTVLTCLHDRDRIYKKHGFEINWKND